MTDRELLELAAKAAGIGGGWGDQIDYHNGSVDLSGHWVLLEGDDLYFFNPLEDDGDALRLAMKLGICIQFIPDCDTVQAYQERSTTGEPFNVHVAGLGDIETRRVITQAAAEIGKAMQEKH